MIKKYPLHLLNLASVRDLNIRISDLIRDLSVIRFRANIIGFYLVPFHTTPPLPFLYLLTWYMIVVSGPKAFDEDDWKLLLLGNGTYYAACRTVRCKMPNIHHETGERHPAEPDRTLRSYRCIDEGYPSGACLGLQIVPATSESKILAVGDKLFVKERGEHIYIPQ
jgi:uncharacterized protein YcbX